jgi:soluble cytochrome b562
MTSFDDLSILLSQLSVQPEPSTVSSPSEEIYPSSANDALTAAQQLCKLKELRTSLQQRLLLSLVRIQHSQGTARKDVESEVEEYRDLLDGMDLLIQRLSRTQYMDIGDTGGVEERRGAYEL